jgi:hypothetical protein
MESTIFTEIDYAQQINDRFYDLGVSTDSNAYSGLTAENVEDSEAVVKIFDDYESGLYYADQVIEKLSDPDEEGNIWEAISSCKI